MTTPASIPDYPLVMRYAVLLRPKTSYFEWLKNARPTDYDEADADFWEPNIYLIAEMFNPAEEEDWLKRNYAKLFDHELYQIDPEMETWPEDRSLETFQSWFQAEFISQIFDTVKGKIEKG